MRDIETLMNIFITLESTSGRNDKEAILKRYADVDGFKEILQFVYNPYIITGLAKKKINKDVGNRYTCQLLDLFGTMEFVTTYNSGSDAVICQVQAFLNGLPEEHRDFAIAVLTKDLKVGITSSTINKVFGKNFIPKYDVMLASKWEDHCHKIKGDFIVTLKLDGIRCTVFNGVAGPTFFTRQGHPIEGLDELKELFRDLPKGYVYDGELIARNVDNLSSDDLFRYTQKLVRKDGSKTGVQFFAFDKLPIEEFHEGKSKKQLHERFDSLKQDIIAINNNLIEMVPTYYIGSDQEQVYKTLELVTQAGFEGLMVSPLNSYYETKRSRTLLKVKKFHTVDLIVTGFEEHKHGAKLGSLVVDYKGYEVKVGSGFNDVERDELWYNRFELIGTVVEVGYFEESKNQNGGISLRFPTFKRLRSDKTTSSYN
jgi:DNA ligase-1